MVFGIIPADSVIAESLAIAVILLPGFLALRIRDALIATKPRPVKDAWLPALLFDLPIFLILLGVAQVKAFNLTPTLVEESFNPMTILAALLIAGMIGLVAGGVEESGWLVGLASKLKITRKSWRSTWASGFREAEGRYANVVLRDGTQLYGWAKHYSATSAPGTLFLARGGPANDPVSILSPSGEEIDVDGPGVLIAPAAGITLVEFVDPDWQRLEDSA